MDVNSKLLEEIDHLKSLVLTGNEKIEAHEQILKDSQNGLAIFTAEKSKKMINQTFEPFCQIFAGLQNFWFIP